MSLFSIFRRLFPSRKTSAPAPEPGGEGVAYYLSLEFLLGGNSYWLATPNGGGCLRHFRVFPVEAFGGRPLNPGRLRWEEGNSELLLFAENGDGARFSSVNEENPETLDLGDCDQLSWNEMCALALIRLPVEDWVGLYHPNKVCLRDRGSPLRIYGDKSLNLADTDYFVSGFMPEEGTLALMGEDHDPPQVNNWIGLQDLDTPAKIREVLLQWKVTAIHLGGYYFAVE